MGVHVEQPLAEPRISKLFIGGHHELMQYELEILDGILDFVVGQNDRVWEYTYHQRFAPWLGFIVQELKRDPWSRRAVISVRDNAVDSSNAHPACLQSLQYFVRGGKLDCAALFRSNDLPEAFFMNAFALIRLQETLADQLGIPVGTYSHKSNSMHTYEKDFHLLHSYAEKIRSAKDEEDICYDYAGFYRDLMLEEIPDIQEMVRQKKVQYGILDGKDTHA